MGSLPAARKKKLYLLEAQLEIFSENKTSYRPGDFVKWQDDKKIIEHTSIHDMPSGLSGIFKACRWYSTKHDRFEWCLEWRHAEEKTSKPIVAYVDVLC